MRILITNDDGVDAEGLHVLERIAAKISDDVWVVAPEQEQSGAARALTLSEPVRVRRISEKKFAIRGTPTDCVLMGVCHLLGDEKPDLVLSGVNNGQNIGEHVTFSGTIAGALQGMNLGVPSIALSQARFTREHIRFETAQAHGPALIKQLVEAGWPRDVVININFPDAAPEEVKTIEVTRLGERDKVNLFVDERVDLRGRSYYWMGFRGHLSNAPEGTDLRAVYDGRISVTPLHLDLTHGDAHFALSSVLNGPSAGER